MKLYKYIFRSPLRGSIYCEELYSDTDGRQELDTYDMARLYVHDSRLADFLEKNSEDVTAYAPENIRNLVDTIELGDYGTVAGNMFLMSHVRSKKELTEDEQSIIRDFITGQLSDGWGESLEQEPWRHDNVELRKPYYDVDYCGWEEDEYRLHGYFHVHPWNSENFYIELHSLDIEEVADPEPRVYHSYCEPQDDGGYKVTTIYEFDDPTRAAECIRNSGAIFCEDFVCRLEGFDDCGVEKLYHIVVVYEGMGTRFKDVLGTINKGDGVCTVFCYNSETGNIGLSKYEHDMMMYLDHLIDK